MGIYYITINIRRINWDYNFVITTNQVKMKKIKIKLSDKSHEELNDIREECGFERKEENKELECLFG